MEIIGYSERGAMNALFYGMAIKNDYAAMNRFLGLAGIAESYSNFRLYMECSLSEYGTPDVVIIADKDGEKKNKKESVVFFIEAKVSACGEYKLEKQLEKHLYGKYDASNLFFQLRSKEYFFNHECKECDPKQYDDIIKCKKGKHGIENCRDIGTNVVVNKFASEIKECESAKYIAIIPEPKDNVTNKGNGCVNKENDYIKLKKDKEGKDVIKFGETWEVHIITWEAIYDKFKDYLEETIKFNQNDNKSQILNRPIKM